VVTPSLGAAATRRALFKRSGGSLAAGAVLGLAACGGGSHPADVRTIPQSVREADVTIINGLLDQAERTIAAYTASVPLLTGHVRAAAKQFLGQDLEHAGVLYRLIKQAKGKADKPAPSYDLGRPRSRTDLVRLLHELERQMVASYLHAIPSLAPGSTRATVASIMASDAQHVSVLRLSLHLDPIPGALITGAE